MRKTGDPTWISIIGGCRTNYPLVGISKEIRVSLIQVSAGALQSAMVIPHRRISRRQRSGHTRLRRSQMTQTPIAGLVALSVGTALLFFAWRGSNAPVDQLSEAMTGRFTGDTMWFMIAGLIGVVAGGSLLLRGLVRS